MSFYQCYTWDFHLTVPPYERLLGVLEAFFASYPRGDYSMELREQYKLEFRRGAWKHMLGLGPLVPARLAPGDFAQWPIKVRVLARPSPESFLIAVRYELYLPRSVKALIPEVQQSVAAHAAVEMHDLSKYLAECMHLETPPALEQA